MSTKRQDPEPEMTLPRDEYSVALREASGHPEAVTKQSIVELIDQYGNCTTWVIKTIRRDGRETVFLQKNDAAGGGRWVLPPKVTEALARQRDGASVTNRRQKASRVAADRKALGIRPAFLKKAVG
jgi:hypothetical protein